MMKSPTPAELARTLERYPGRVEVLKVHGRYPYLSAWQVRDILYKWESEASRKAANDHQTALTRLGLLYDGNTYGKDPSVEMTGTSRIKRGGFKVVRSLTELGQRVLTELDYPSLLTIPKRHERSHEYLGHVKLATDSLIRVERYGNETPGITVNQCYHEHELRNMLPPTVAQAIPDGFVSYTVDGLGTVGIGIEADRGTEREYPDPSGAGNWSDKVQGLRQLMSNPPNADIRVSLVAVVIRSIRKPNADRLADLLTWTEGAVSDDPRWLDLFRFTIADPTTMTPEDFVSTSHWVRYLGNGMTEQVPLLSL